MNRTNGTHRAVRGVAAPPRGDARRRPVRPALLAVVLLGAAGGLTACGHGASDAVTTLRGATGVTVTTAAGAVSAAVDGERLAVGDTVRTSSARAALLTGGRVTTLDADTAVLIAARSRYVLSGGTLVLDRRDGAPATVDAGPVTVDRIGRTAVRVEDGFAVRVALYAGGGAEVSASQRSVVVPALHEVDVAGTSLPTAVPPLALRDDALDAVADPDLVAADIALVRRSTALDGPAAAGLAATLRSVVPSVLPAAVTDAADVTLPLSERVLPIAIARAAGGNVTGLFQQAGVLRAAGGSWGVVAALLGAGVGSVQQQIDALVDAAPGSVAAAPPAGTTPATGLAAGPGAGSGTGTAGSGTAPTVEAGGGTVATSAPVSPSGPTTGTATGSAPTPTPSTTALVPGLVGTVLGLLAPSSSSAPRAGTSPAPTPTGLLGGVLGGH